jgi:primary-amine oxidase
MAAETISSVPAVLPMRQSESHPLAPLTADEITRSADLIRGVWPPTTDLHFKVITLWEPPKHEVLPYIDAEHNGSRLPRLTRKAFVNYYLRNTV